MMIHQVSMANTFGLQTIATQQFRGTEKNFVKCTYKSKCQTEKCLYVINNTCFMRYKMSCIICKLQ